MKKKIAIHLLGLFTLALGITSVLIIQIGASPLDAFNFFFHKLTNEKLTVGATTFITNATMAFIIFLFTRKKELSLSLVVAIILSLFIDLWMKIFTFVPSGVIESFFFRIPVGILSLFIISISTAVLIVNNLVLSPYDEMTLFITSKTNSLRFSKILLDASFLLGAIFLGIITKELWTQINVFSVIIVIGLGPLINYFVKKIEKEKKDEIK